MDSAALSEPVIALSEPVIIFFLLAIHGQYFLSASFSFWTLSNDPGEVDSSFFCYAATVLSPHRNVLIFTQRMHKPT